MTMEDRKVNKVPIMRMKNLVKILPTKYQKYSIEVIDIIE